MGCIPGLSVLVHASIIHEKWVATWVVTYLVTVAVLPASLTSFLCV